MGRYTMASCGEFVPGNSTARKAAKKIALLVWLSGCQTVNHWDRCEWYPLLENDTRKWEEIDEWQLNQSLDYCLTVYGKCIKVFHKLGTNNYRVICGGKPK